MVKKLLHFNEEGKIVGQIYSAFPNEKLFTETWLQDLLFLNPELLPIKEINESWNEPIPLGREVSVVSGPLDNPWPILVLPKIIAKTHEVTRAVVKIRYETKKPEIEATGMEEDASKIKTDKLTFEKSLPENYADLLIPILKGWIDDRRNP